MGGGQPARAGPGHAERAGAGAGDVRIRGGAAHTARLLLGLSRDHKYPKINADQVAELSARTELPQILASETPLGPDQAAGRLGVRRVDFEWMRRPGWIEPVSYGRVQFGATKAGAAHMPRFSTRHIDDRPQQHPESGCPALHTLGKGQRSPLATLYTGQKKAPF
ncbi:hypothetical protein [Streptomyces angustmyceticus]|uniref:hypothetical protein n=1 Tax=Streptomyces angustmyceticus TaxID=285578 RepID=UPI003D8B00BF